MISCNLLFTSPFLMTLSKSIKTHHKLHNNNDGRERKASSQASHKWISADRAAGTVGGDRCLIYFCYRGDLIPHQDPSSVTTDAREVQEGVLHFVCASRCTWNKQGHRN